MFSCCNCVFFSTRLNYHKLIKREDLDQFLTAFKTKAATAPSRSNDDELKKGFKWYNEYEGDRTPNSSDGGGSAYSRTVSIDTGMDLCVSSSTDVQFSPFNYERLRLATLPANTKVRQVAVLDKFGKRTAKGWSVIEFSTGENGVTMGGYVRSDSLACCKQ